MEAGDTYKSQMTSFPVISLTLQMVTGESFEIACQQMTELLCKCFQEKKYLLNSPALDQTDRLFFERIYLGPESLNDLLERPNKGMGKRE